MAIISSYRKNGHTSKVISLLKEQMELLTEKDNILLDFEVLFLGDYEINHCKGCRICMDVGENLCPWKDDIPLVKSKMKEADAIIFASPVFVGNVSSSMKALIDRLAYVCHRQEFYEKCAVILATTNATSLRRTIHTMGGAAYSWGFKLIGTKGFRTSSSNDSMETLKERYVKDLSKLAGKIYHGMKDKVYLKPSALSLAVFKIQQKYRANPAISSKIDFEYWKMQGWTDSKKSYFIHHESGVLKRITAKLIYNLISIFIHD